ncbi:MipA/OmpV family protein [Catenovulum agarivorans]|uniref:MipA/OmpV family protein n=1 Tax=Catenovulum agarivorans TaxID=1172192 RepID=UPI00030C6D36|nr:MipA/OmpV family protein [Catenovulum agarivorans]
MKFFHKQKFIDLKALLLLLPFIGSLHAEQSSAERAEVGELSISLAVGYGEKSNPLHKGDAFPLLLVPAVHYYGKNWYFDNGDLAYTLVENSDYSVNLVTSFNGEAAHFYDWHPANILAVSQFVQSDVAEQSPEFKESEQPAEPSEDPASPSPGVGGGDNGGQGDGVDAEPQTPVGITDIPEQNQKQQVEKIHYDQIAKRKWNLDAGAQLHWFIDEQQQIKIRWMYDVMGVHQGHSLKLEYSHKWRFNQWRHKIKFGIDWLSSDLVNYYYGISQRDTQAQSLWYQPGAASLPYLGYASSYKFNDTWSWVLSAHYQQLTSKIADSPIVAKDYRYTLFTGIKYVF